MQACVAKDSTKSVPLIYNECRNEAADEFPGSSKEAFLQTFPSYKACQKTLYTERRTKVPPNPHLRNHLLSILNLIVSLLIHSFKVLRA